MADRFTKTATTNAILLIEIALLIILLIRFGDKRNKLVDTSDVNTVIVDESIPINDSVSTNLQPFDPNTATYEELRAIGMSRREAVSLIKYRATGKVFRIKEDVALCYNISDSAYSKLAPYICIGEEFRIKPNTYDKQYTDYNKRRFPRDSIQYIKPSLFRIDTVSVSYLRAIGALTKRQAEAFIRWRNQSGFRDMEEVRACYVISDSIADILEQYIIFPERELSLFDKPIEINSADSATLIKVIGIGPKTVNTIIQYRQRLGGFYSLEQLCEVQGVTESNYEKIVNQVCCDREVIRTINVNSCAANDLIHPYISRINIRKLIRQRQLSGKWANIDEMVQQGIFSKEEASRIAPYFTFDDKSDTIKM